MFGSKAEYLLFKVPFSFMKKQCKYCICWPWKIPENIPDLLCGRKDMKKDVVLKNCTLKEKKLTKQEFVKLNLLCDNSFH